MWLIAAIAYCRFASCVAWCARNHNMQLLKQNVASEDCMLRLPNEPPYATTLNATFIQNDMRHLYRTVMDISSVVRCRFIVRACRMHHTTRDGKTEHATIETQCTSLITENIRGRRSARNTYARCKTSICNDRYQPPSIVKNLHEVNGHRISVFWGWWNENKLIYCWKFIKPPPQPPYWCYCTCIIAQIRLSFWVTVTLHFVC